MSCPQAQACSMGDRRQLSVSTRAGGPLDKCQEAGGARPEDDITVLDDTPVLVVPVHEPELRQHKVQLQHKSAKVGMGGASTR